MYEIHHLDHVAIRVTDVEASANWYGEVLGMKPVFEGMWGGVPTMLALGSTLVALFPVRDDDPDDAPLGRVRVDHFAFRTDRENFQRARQEIPARGIPVEYQDHEISHSIYMADPDGHTVEITTYDV